RFRGEIARPHVLVERERDEPADDVVGPAQVERHGYFVPLRGPGRRLPPPLPRAPFCEPRPPPRPLPPGPPRRLVRDLVCSGFLPCFLVFPPAPRVPFFAPPPAARRPALPRLPP